MAKMGKVSFSYSTCKFWYHPHSIVVWHAAQQSVHSVLASLVGASGWAGGNPQRSCAGVGDPVKLDERWSQWTAPSPNRRHALRAVEHFLVVD